MLSWQSEDPSAPGAAPPPLPPPSSRQSELEFKLLQDTGKWSGEYSYAVGDGMWGARGLYHFSPRPSSNPLAVPPLVATSSLPSASDELGPAVEEEEEVISAGLRGRWSAGGEVFFSAKEPAAGMSAAVRFSTLPPEKSDYPQQPPTTMTATVNPIIGQISTAYAVETSADSAMASRFDFNLYSYDAEVTVGGEWFQRRTRSPTALEDELLAPSGKAVEDGESIPLRPSFDAFGRGDYADPGLLGDQSTASPAASGLPPVLGGAGGAKVVSNAEDDVRGVLKWRASTTAVSPIALSSSISQNAFVTGTDAIRLTRCAGPGSAVGGPARQLSRLARGEREPALGRQTQQERLQAGAHHDRRRRLAILCLDAPRYKCELASLRGRHTFPPSQSPV